MRGLKGQRLVALFLFGALFLDYPVFSLFAGNGTIFGVPVLYAYVFFVWAALIALMAFIVGRRGD